MKEIRNALCLLAVAVGAGAGCSSHVAFVQNGISGSSALRRTQSHPQNIPALAESTLIGPAILLLDSSGKQIGKLKAPYWGLVSYDPEGDIYLSASNTALVYLYTPPYTQPPSKIGFPGDVNKVAIDWKTGIFSVNTDSASPGVSPKVLFFRHGSTTPCATVKVPSDFLATTSAFDDGGTLYTAMNINGNYTIISVAGECSAQSFQTYNASFQEVTTIQFDADDNIAIDTSIYNNAPLLVYAHPQQGQLGRLVHKIYLHKINGMFPIMETLGSDGKSLWAATYNWIAQYPYPQGGEPIKKVYIYHNSSTAVYPALQP